MAEYWKTSLIKELNDPNCIILSSEECVVLKDTYPKAQYHYLILPKAEIDNLYELKHAHLPLLDDMLLLAYKIILEHTPLKIKDYYIGFLMDAQINRLKMHVISNDFVSEHLKKNRHWTNFNTKIFMPFRMAYGILKVTGCIMPLMPAELEILRKTPLKCNQCEYIAQSMFYLKKHLEFHWHKKMGHKMTIHNIDIDDKNDVPTTKSNTPQIPSLLDVKIDYDMILPEFLNKYEKKDIPAQGIDKIQNTTLETSKSNNEKANESQEQVPQAINSAKNLQTQMLIDEVIDILDKAKPTTVKEPGSLGQIGAVSTTKTVEETTNSNTTTVRHRNQLKLIEILNNLNI